MRTHRVALPLALLVVASGAQATLSDEGFYQELPVVLNVTRLAQVATEIPAAVTLIDRAMIDAAGVSDLPELFRLVAGFQVGHFWSNRTSVTYHGMSDEYSRRMQVLIDGRSVYSPETGGVHWADLPISLIDIEHIEVIRGPNGVSFGANAFLGAINIITLHPDKVRSSLIRHDGSDSGLHRTTLRHAVDLGSHQHRITVESSRDNGFDDYYEAGNGRLWHFADNKHSTSVNYRGEYRPGINDYLSLQLGAKDGEQQEGFFASLTEGPHNDRHQRQFAQLRWKRVFSTDNDLELNLYHIQSDMESIYDTALLSTIFSTAPGNIPLITGYPDQVIHLDRSMHSRRTNLELQQRLKPHRDWRLVWGGETRLDRVSTPSYIGPRESAENRMSRLFLHNEWRPIENWLVNLGTMYERSDLGGNHLSPRAGVIYSLNQEQALRLTYTRAYRAPVVLEQFADYAARFSDGQVLDQMWSSPGGLESEQIDSYEIGFSGQSHDGRLRYDVSRFRSHMRNLITTPIDRQFVEPFNALCGPPVNAPGFCTATVFSNQGSASAEGYELQLYLRPNEQQLLSLGYSDVKAVDNNLRYINPYTPRTNDLTTPRQTLSLLIEQGLGSGLRASAGLYRTGDMLFTSGDATGGTTRLDLRLVKRTKIAGKALTIELKSQHIGGEDFDFIYRITQKNQFHFSASLEL